VLLWSEVLRRMLLLLGFLWMELLQMSRNIYSGFWKRVEVEEVFERFKESWKGSWRVKISLICFSAWESAGCVSRSAVAWFGN